MNPERDFLDKDIWPDALDELILANDLACALCKRE